MAIIVLIALFVCISFLAYFSPDEIRRREGKRQERLHRDGHRTATELRDKRD